MADVHIRIKEPLRARIEKAADERGVSMNTMIVRCINLALALDETLERGEKADNFVALSEAIYGGGLE